MKIQYVSCPQCGAKVHAPELNRINYCSYCGVPLYIDDGISRSVTTTIIRDEARLKEAENASRRLDIEEQKLKLERDLYRREQSDRAAKTAVKAADAAAYTVGIVLRIVLSVIGIAFLILTGLIYLVSPVDLLSGVVIDDIIVVYFIVKAISHIGQRMGR